MKKILVLNLCFLAFSCEKEEETQCNCGLVLSDDVTDYSVVIRSDCSGNEKKFILQQGDWFNAHPGQNYCITNTTGW